MQDHLFYASVNRCDQTVAIKKKMPGGSSNGGTYFTLASGSCPWATRGDNCNFEVDDLAVFAL